MIDRVRAELDAAFHHFRNLVGAQQWGFHHGVPPIPPVPAPVEISHKRNARSEPELL
jgi:hypothetical protein